MYFVPLNPLDDSTQIVNAIAVTINHSFSEGDNSQQQLLDFLRPKSMLLVLDSFEHLVTQGELVPILLQEAPGLKILVTSRIRLNVAGEQLFPIAGIDFPQPEDSLEQASQSDAIRLFVQSARRMKPGYELGGEDLQNVVQICRLVEGMPLSIILAAAWTEILSPAEIKSEIERSLDFLEIHIWDAPGRHWSIRSVFKQSWELLTEQEQHVFQNLSVFRDGFKTQAGLAVSDASIQVMRALVNKSLLGCTLTGRFQIHELLR